MFVHRRLRMRIKSIETHAQVVSFLHETTLIIRVGPVGKSRSERSVHRLWILIDVVTYSNVSIRCQHNLFNRLSGLTAAFLLLGLRAAVIFTSLLDFNRVLRDHLWEFVFISVA